MMLSCSRALDVERELSCVSGSSGVVQCADEATVNGEDTLLYIHEVGPNVRTDLAVTLSNLQGSPVSFQLRDGGGRIVRQASVITSGEHTLFVGRGFLSFMHGRWSVAVSSRGSAPSTFSLSLHASSTFRELAAADRAALESLVAPGSPCCRAASCSRLREQLRPLGPEGGLCQAPGSACDADGRVIELDLSDQLLGCPLPDSLLALTQLRRLTAERAGLRGPAQEALVELIAALPRLQALRLAGNGLHGALGCLPAAPALLDLDLSDNALGGALPACLLRESGWGLERLALAGAGLSGTLRVDARSALRQLDVSRSELGDGGARLDFGGWPRLQRLSAQQARLRGELPAFGESLQVVELGLNDLRGELRGLEALPRLAVLHLEDNQLSGELPSALPPSLKSLSLARNRLSGSLAAAAALPALQALDVRSCAFSGALPPALFARPELRVLDLAQNALSGDLAAALAAAPPASLARLRVLDVSHNAALSWAAPPELAGLGVFDPAGRRAWVGGVGRAPALDLSGNPLLRGELPVRLWEALAAAPRATLRALGTGMACPEAEPREDLRRRLGAVSCLDPRTGQEVSLGAAEGSAEARPDGRAAGSRRAEAFAKLFEGEDAEVPPPAPGVFAARQGARGWVAGARERSPWTWALVSLLAGVLGACALGLGAVFLGALTVARAEEAAARAQAGRAAAQARQTQMLAKAASARLLEEDEDARDEGAAPERAQALVSRKSTKDSQGEGEAPGEGSTPRIRAFVFEG